MIKEIDMRKVNIQNIYDFVILKKNIDPYLLTSEAEHFYHSVKVVGIENTMCTYFENGKAIICNGTDVPEIMRAMTIFIVKLIFRWSDDTSGRLENHFKLTTSIGNILSSTGIFKTNNSIMECINVKDVIYTYIHSK